MCELKKLNFRKKLFVTIWSMFMYIYIIIKCTVQPPQTKSRLCDWFTSCEKQRISFMTVFNLPLDSILLYQNLYIYLSSSILYGSTYSSVSTVSLSILLTDAETQQYQFYTQNKEWSTNWQEIHFRVSHIVHNSFKGILNLHLFLNVSSIISY